MSRIGKQPIELPARVEANVTGSHVAVKGPLGELEHEVPPELEVELTESPRALTVTRRNNSRRARSLHGLHRTLLANKVQGVQEEFVKRLELYGTGYSVSERGRQLVMQVGFCHEVVLDLPDGISLEIGQASATNDRAATFAVKGIDKEAVGHFAARVRAVRPPEPYKGKGIRYEGEYVRRKEAKAFAAGLER